MAEFFAMGGYGGYVWSCFAIVALVMVILLVQSLRDLEGVRRDLDRLEQAGAGRRRKAIDTETSAS